MLKNFVAVLNSLPQLQSLGHFRFVLHNICSPLGALYLLKNEKVWRFIQFLEIWQMTNRPLSFGMHFYFFRPLMFRNSLCGFMKLWHCPCCLLSLPLVFLAFNFSAVLLLLSASFCSCYYNKQTCMKDLAVVLHRLFILLTSSAWSCILRITDLHVTAALLLLLSV